jgi:hypothetical protein
MNRIAYTHLYKVSLWWIFIAFLKIKTYYSIQDKSKSDLLISSS